MKCARCNNLVGDDGDSEPAVVELFYNYEFEICHSCLDDYLLTFMSELAQTEIEADVLDVMTMPRATATPQEVREQSKIVNDIRQHVLKKIIMWIRAGI